jgi:predicted metal-dependent hydrolase
MTRIAGRDPRFKKGLELFNGQEFFECHEVIEDLWLETPMEDHYRDLYKGVIQAAAAVYQWERGIASGALGLYKTSVQYLKKYEPVSLGLNVEKMVRDMDQFFRDFKKESIPVLEYA